jgi:uncharacterized protein YoxC
MEPWLVYLIAVAALAAIAVCILLLWRLSRAAAQAEQFLAQLNQMSPRLERILAEAELELSELRKVTQKVDDIALHVSTITQKAAGVAAPALDGAGALAKPLKYISAAVAGAQALMQFFRTRKGRAEQDESPQESTETQVAEA